MRVGVLALQGAVLPHCLMLQTLGVEAVQVKSTADLELCDRLILPGGESTTMLKLLAVSKLTTAISNFAASKPIWGICAGAILIASEVKNPEQESLSLIPMRAYRNHYGSQLESFKTFINVNKVGPELEVDFIRAPLLEPLSDKVEVLAEYNGQSVLLKHDRILASSFHVELGSDTRLHKYFLSL